MGKQQQSSDDDIPAIIHEQIFAEWVAGKSAKQIAHEMGLDLATVMRSIKRRQKSLVYNEVSKGRRL